MNVFELAAAAPEDFVEYTVFLPRAASGTHEGAAGACAALMRATQAWAAEYLWHREPFELHVSDSPVRYCLQGRTQFGENIEVRMRAGTHGRAP